MSATRASGRIPPHSVELEEQLLSACLLDGGEVVARCLQAGVSPASFYVPANRLLFQVVLDQFSIGSAIDMPTIGIQLQTSRQLDEIGGWSYLTRVSGLVPTTAGVSMFIERLVQLAQLRDAIRAATGIVESCYGFTGGVPREHLAADLERLSEALAVHAQARSWSDAVLEAKAEAIERMKPKADRKKEMWAVTWPWPDMQACFLAIEPSELVILAARPSVGKSSMARQLAWATNRNGYPVLFHTLEVGDSELATNLAANLSRRPARRDIDKLHPSDQRDLLAAFDELAKPAAAFAAVTEDDTVASMIARARAFKQRHGLRLWVIDYLGLIADCEPGRGENKASAIGRVTRALKRFAATERVPIVLLCQLNREMERENRCPMLSDLRDSGRIEEDANRVLFLYRPTQWKIGDLVFSQDLSKNPAELETHYIEAIQAKGRNTGTGSVALNFHRPTASFRSFSR